ncbi:hypothetical protein GCM10028801_00820 [Nocardioides maradonensis]
MNLNDWFGDGNDPGWIVVYVVVALLVLGGLAVLARRKKRDRDRERAASIRAEARRDEPRLARREAEARRLEAESSEARAEADRREAMARSHRQKLEGERKEYVDRMREADRIDPDADGAAHRADTADRTDVSDASDRERHDASH